MIHVFVKFEDQFSFAYVTRIVTRSASTFEKMKKGIGTIVPYFDKKQHIRLALKVLEVRQATPDDYDATRTS